MKLFKDRLSADKVFTDVMDKVDDSKFTIEEKNRFNWMRAEKVAEFASKSAGENSIKSRSRRFMSYVIVINYFVMFWVIVVSYLTDNIELADKMKEAAGNSKLTTAFVMVLAFYFGGYYATNLISKKQK